MNRRPASPLLASLTLAAAVGVFGGSFGVLAVASGLSVAKTMAMSLLVFTGASQFAAVGIIGAGGSPFAALGSALLLASRNLAYGLVLAPIVRGGPIKRLFGAQFVIDESTAMATAQTEPDDQAQAFWATGVAIFVCWNVGTLLGALGGSVIGDPNALGLDAAFPAGFVVLIAPHLRRFEGRLAAALIVVGTFADGQSLVLDARAAGVGVAALAAWRGLPFPVVIVVAAAVTAVIRLW